ncbi:Probable ADP-ribosylation factor GTPase-activating protein AGD14 [Linum perenne]
MVKKEKEEERIEKIIRGLLKQSENRRCINCNSLGPQYVCTTFLTFVCTNCSGVHREFTHRVKSVSMAKFSAEEVGALQAGGNERARQIYFKDWDAQRNSYPDGSNLHRLRDFIKHVYVERKYTGERGHDMLRKLRVGESDESYDGRKSGIFYGRSPSYGVTRSSGPGLTKCPSYEVTRSPTYEVTRSPSFEDRRSVRDRYGSNRRSADRSFRNYYDEMRNPYQPESSRYVGVGFKKSPVRFEVVDDRYRDDENRNRKLSDSARLSRKDPSTVSGSRSPDSKKIPPVQVEEKSKANEGKEADVSASNEMATPSSSKAPTNKIPLEGKSQNSESLIDLNNDSTSKGVVPPPPTAQKLPSTDSSAGSPVKKEPLAPKPNTVEFLLFELSVPSVTPSSSNVPGVYNAQPSTASEGCINAVGASSESNAGPSAVESARSIPADNVSSAEPFEQMSVVPYQAPAPTSVPASGGYGSMTVGSSGMPVGQISESFSSINASAAESGGTKFAEGCSPAASYKQSLSLFDGFNSTSVPSAAKLPVQPSNGGLPEVAPDPFGGSSFTANSSHKVEQQDQFPTKPSIADNSTGEGLSTSVAGESLPTSVAVKEINNQPCTSLNAPNEQGPPVASVEHTSQHISQAASVEHTSQQISQAGQESNSGIQKPSTTSETKSSGRQELPADLFASSFMPSPGPTPSWHNHNPYGMGFGTQYYHNPMQQVMAYPNMAYPNPVKSTNPFDFNNDNPQRHTTSFGSMGDLRGGAVDVPPRPVLFPSSSMGHISSAMIPDTSQIPSQPFPFQSTISSGPYMEHQAYINDVPSRSQGGRFGGDEDPFASLNVIQKLPSFAARQNSLPSRGGNPFG